MAPKNKVFSTLTAVAVGSLITGQVLSAAQAFAEDTSTGTGSESSEQGENKCGGDKKCGGGKSDSGEKSESGDHDHDHGDHACSGKKAE